ncbi:MAG: hypothetical protein JRE43_03000, partial [Deltaproteobacteria bacterium]|nr:hypothetical protein [Deltaproteobacteria bacterium]
GIEDRPFSAVLGATALRVDTENQHATFVDSDGREAARVTSGDVVSIDGHTGEIWIGTRAIQV